MASHDPAGPADLLTNEEGTRAERKDQDDAALLVSGASFVVNLKLTIIY
jgi:hypothetical protein